MYCIALQEWFNKGQIKIKVVRSRCGHVAFTPNTPADNFVSKFSDMCRWWVALALISLFLKQITLFEMFELDLNCSWLPGVPLASTPKGRTAPRILVA